MERLKNLTAAQARMVEEIKGYGGETEFGAEYWAMANDWVKGPLSLSLVNITRTFGCLLRAGVVTLDDDGYVHLVQGRAV